MIQEDKSLKLVKPEQIIKEKIFFIRGQKVMFAHDLAEIYGIETKRLNEQVKRNIERFPEDFMFQLNEKEIGNMRSQFATPNLKQGGVRYLPYVFTEHGVAMLSSVLNSPRAIQMNIYIIRAFIKIREMLAIDKNIELKLLKFESELNKRGKDIEGILSILKKILNEPLKPLGPMGFQDNE